MSYTIKDFLESNQFPNTYLINDESKINQEIKGIRIIEVPDIEKYLTGGEVLLTSLRAYKDINEEDFLSHLEALNQKQISGFIVKKFGGGLSYQTDLFNILLKYSKEHQIPVLEIPEDSNAWAVVKYLMNQIFDIEAAKLSYFKMTHDNLYHYLTDGSDAKNSIATVLSQASDMLGNPVALFRSDHTCIASTDLLLSELQEESDFEEYVPDTILKEQYFRRKGKYVEYIKKFEIFQKEIFLYIFEKNDPLTVLDFIGLENLNVILLSILMRTVTEQNLAKKYHRDLQHSILTGSLSVEEEDEAASIIGLKDSDDLKVVMFQMLPKDKESKFTSKQIKEAEFIEREVLKVLHEKNIYTNTNRIICIHKINEKEQELNFRLQIEELQKQIQKKLIERDAEIVLHVGIGQTVKGYHHLKKSFDYSKMALNYIDVIRKIVGDKNKSVVDCSKLGFFRIFTKLNDKNELMTYIPESLHKLVQYDQKKNTELINTLECFLNNNQSLKKTSQQMHVHYRTISYRMQKIEEISGMDFDNAAEMLAVRNGLIIFRILEQV